MAETPTPSKQVMLKRIYVKDCSFESPRSPEVFDAPVNPEVEVSMRTVTNKLAGDEVEVVLSITVQANSDKRATFLVEVHQAGLFGISGFNEAENKAILASYCPSILFPYAREVISDLVIKGSMPALLLQPVNFDMMFAQSMAEAASGPK
ncbi:MAG TPA: protein-export chaperone SecB [Gammaproteobacteria bacterium]|jgi:preprotein translocase subunit SecB